MFTVAHRIVVKHDGNISVYSEGEGRGCTFTLTLPLFYKIPEIINEFDDNNDDIIIHVNEMNSTRNNDEFNSDENGSIGILSLRAGNNANILNIIKRVLIVDDAPMNRKMLRRILQERIELIDEAEDGQIAVTMIRESIDNNHQSFDVILMDFVMPNMNGPEATRHIRDMGYKGIIIGVTGNTLQSDIDEFKLHGANDVLPKPLDINAMETLLRDKIIITLENIIKTIYF